MPYWLLYHLLLVGDCCSDFIGECGMVMACCVHIAQAAGFGGSIFVQNIVHQTSGYLADFLYSEEDAKKDENVENIKNIINYSGTALSIVASIFTIYQLCYKHNEMFALAIDGKAGADNWNRNYYLHGVNTLSLIFSLAKGDENPDIAILAHAFTGMSFLSLLGFKPECDGAEGIVGLPICFASKISAALLAGNLVLNHILLPNILEYDSSSDDTFFKSVKEYSYNRIFGTTNLESSDDVDSHLTAIENCHSYEEIVVA